MPQMNQNIQSKLIQFSHFEIPQFLDCFRKIRNPKLTISGDAVFSITWKIVATKATGRFATEPDKSKKSFVIDPSPISKGRKNR
jgi:hypothetical protein